MCQPIAVLDFETTGMMPAQGARATEVAIVRLEGGRIVDRFQSLMRTGVWIPPFITRLTGITNAMVDAAPPAAEVMQAAAAFVGTLPLVAHNAAFDRQFWQAELALAGLPAPHAFACTVLLSRRIYPDAPSHKLGALVQHLGLPQAGRAHRALADAEMAAHLLARLQADLQLRWGTAFAHPELMDLQRCPRPQLARLLQRLAARAQVPLPL